MANVWTCVLFLLVVNYRLVVSQPTFGSSFWCNMFCGDEDDSSEESGDYGSFLDLFDVCAGCSTGSSEAVTTTTVKPLQQPVKLMIPPATGMNLTVISTIGGVLLDLIPWLAPAAPAPAATTAAPAVTKPVNGSEGNATKT